jgi:hypothetical protein
MTTIEIRAKIDHPFRTGAFADVQETDSLWKLLEVVKEEQSKLRICELELRKALGLLTQGETKTRRLIGESVKLKLEFPSDYWTQSILSELVKEDPEQSQVYIRVSQYAPNLKEVKKLEAANGNERFEQYRAKLLSARSPSTAPPTVTIDK